LPRRAQTRKASALKSDVRGFVEAIDTLSVRLTPERRAEDHGLPDCSVTELRALAVLGRQRPLMMSDLAEAMKINVSTATRTIDKLVAKGLTERKRIKNDRRVVRVDFSRKGEEIHKYVTETRLAQARAILEALSPAHRRIFLQRLRALSAG
jgi:DNA-binding MarR family transcriptional regulator